MATCQVCFRHCKIEEGKLGHCGARTCIREDAGNDGNCVREAAGSAGAREAVVPVNYGIVTALALDPIEKKPLRRFHPGSMILSVGSYGCNLRCPFCQNNSISWSADTMVVADLCREAVDSAVQAAKREGYAAGSGWPQVVPADLPISVDYWPQVVPKDLPMGVDYCPPEKLVKLAERYRIRGNIGVAFTYNEPLVGYEFVRDTARLIHERGMKNVMVTNGTAEPEILEELIPWIDAMNIDLKGFREDWYSKKLGGSLPQVKTFIEKAVRHCHVELTTLIIPGENDSEEEMREIISWIAGLKDEAGVTIGRRIPLHISRFFPQFHMTDRDATDVDHIYHLAELARENLDYVYTGNC